MNLLEKYRRKFETSEESVMQGHQIMLPILTIDLPEDVKEAYKERAAIMEHEGGLSRDQADKYAWCREVCMLTKGQAELCERVKPCPKYSEGGRK